MITIIYDTIEEKVLHRINGDYIVDGKIETVDLPLIKLVEKLSTIPIYDKYTHKCIESWVINGSMWEQVWTIISKTQQEIINEKNEEANNMESTLNVVEIKKLLQITADAQSSDELYKFPSIYSAWKVGINVLVNEKYQYNGKLYKVIQFHKTQLDWTPDIAKSLFTEYFSPESIQNWTQPTGAQDAYNIGDKVKFEGSIYESLINANVWSPIMYPTGWKKIT